MGSEPEVALDRQRVKALFSVLRELPEAEWRARLARSRDPVAVRDEVLSLLVADQVSEVFFDRAREGSEPKTVPVGVRDDQLPDGVEFLGPYRVLRTLGTGGMGVVFEAEQANPRRRVAVKVIRSLLAPEEVLERFRNEARILGELEHPRIARIYDAGEAEIGAHRVPYFAMELVEGVALSAWVQRAKPRLEAKLELLLQVGDAIQYAHQKGFIHRDLKPGNILVDAYGNAKVLDFGVARAVDVESVSGSTLTGQLLGTVSYMSPEQAGGDRNALDARSDVYALGVIAFELLSGEVPHDIQGLPLYDALKTIRETPARRLSQVSPQLRGDLESVVGMALQHDREKRYASVRAFTDDLRRVLGREPVLARTPSLGYQFLRFARRHWLFLVALSAVVLTLTTALILTTRQLDMRIAAEREARRQQRAAEDAVQISDTAYQFLRDLLDASSGSTHDPNMSVRTWMDETAHRLATAPPQNPNVEARLHDLMGMMYRGVAYYDEAIRHFERVLTVSREQEGDRDGPLTAAALSRVGGTLLRRGDVENALRLLDAAVAMVERLGLAGHPFLAEVHGLRGEALAACGSLEEAGKEIDWAIAETQRLGMGTTAEMGDLLVARGNVHLRKDETQKALEVLTQAMAVRLIVHDEVSPEVGEVYNNQATCFMQAGDFDAAIEGLEKALGISKRRLPVTHPSLLAIYINLAGSHYMSGRSEEGAAVLSVPFAATKELAYETNHRNEIRRLMYLCWSRMDIAETKGAQECGEVLETSEPLRRLLSELQYDLERFPEHAGEIVTYQLDRVLEHRRVDAQSLEPARVLAERALRLIDAAVGPRLPESLTLLRVLSTALTADDRAADAGELLRRRLALLGVEDLTGDVQALLDRCTAVFGLPTEER